MAAARHFTWHLGEMFGAMMIGMALLDGVLRGILWLAGTSYVTVLHDAPVAVALVLMLNMTAPMLLWMRVRGHAASEVSAMGVGMVAVGVVTVFLLWLSVIDSQAICGLECGLMLPAMVGVMLVYPRLQARSRRLRPT